MFSTTSVFFTLVIAVNNIQAYIRIPGGHQIITSQVSRASQSLSLHAWGVQKLGQAVISHNTTSQLVVSDETSSFLRFLPSGGSGDDERFHHIESSEFHDADF
eukprot:gene16483-22356_t